MDTAKRNKKEVTEKFELLWITSELMTVCSRVLEFSDTCEDFPASIVADLKIVIEKANENIHRLG